MLEPEVCEKDFLNNENHPEIRTLVERMKKINSKNQYSYEKR